MPFGGLLTVGLISAGTSLAGGALAAHGASKAADKQQQAADASLALQRDIFNRSQENLSPYMNLGQGAVSKLAGLTNIDLSNMPVRPPIGPSGLPPATVAAWQAKTPSAVTPGNGLGAIQRFNRFLPEFRQQFASAVAAGNGQPAPQTASAYTTMRTPDGRTVNVPTAMVGEALSRGASHVHAPSTALAA